MLDLSIIIVNWNTKDLLKECLKSIYKETEDILFEIYVVDNASSDGSSKMIKEGFPRVNLIENKKNVGFSIANNQAIKLGKGNYILLLNPDTVVLNRCLEKMLEFMEGHPGVGAAGCKIFDSSGNVDYFRSAKRFPTPFTRFFVDLSLDKMFPKIKLFGKYSMTGWDRNDVREVDVLSGAFMFMRRETIEDVGLLDENFFILAEDIDLCYRIKKNNWKIMFNPDAKIIHHIGQSIDRVKMTRLKNAIYSNLLYFQKHHNAFASLSFRVLTSISNLIKTFKWIGRFLFKGDKSLSASNIRSHLQAFFLCFTTKTGYKKD